jgi:ribosomal protein S8
MEEKTLALAPEALTIANTYLKTLDVSATARELNIDSTYIAAYLRKSEVKLYLNSVFLDQGYLNKFRLSDTLNELIQNKLDSLREAETTSNKDILELLQFAHKMRMDEMKAEVEYEKAKSAIKNQKNIQINNNFGENYSKFMEKLLGDK